MDTQKISKILNLIEIAENNLKTAQLLLRQLGSGSTPLNPSFSSSNSSLITETDASYLEVVEGNFDGEHMLGDDGKVYTIPANYASKTKLVVGDRMKRILTDTYREVYKVIQKAPAKRVVGVFTIDQTGEFVVMVDTIPHPIKVLKASITFAMKQQNLIAGDTVALLVPATIDNSTSIWGAFDTVVKHGNENQDFSLNPELTTDLPRVTISRPSLETLKEQVISTSIPDEINMPAAAGMPNPFDSLDEFKI